jgi:hypothetical protein
MIPLNQLLPPRTATLVQLISLAKHDPGMLGLVIEALLHAPLALGIDATDLRQGDGWARPADHQIVPAQIRHREQGIPEFSYFVCSDPDQSLALGSYGERYYSYFNFATGLKPLQLLVTMCEPRPIVLDAGSPHMLVMSHEVVSELLAAWCEPPSLTRPPCAAADGVPAFATLVERVRAFLPQLESVERAYLTFYEPASDGPSCDLVYGLAVLCDDEPTLMRIARALPLLSRGLAVAFGNQHVLRLLLPPEEERGIEDCFTLIYEAGSKPNATRQAQAPPKLP